MSTKKSSPRSAKKIVAPIAHTQRRSDSVHTLHHHAHVIEHTIYDVPLRERINVNQFKPEDIHEFVFQEGGVDEVKVLQERVYLRPRGEQALYLAAFGDLTLQAQNKLLKLLEDPPAHAIMVLGVPSPRTLLETIRSRVHVLADAALPTEVRLDPQQLLAASLPQRLVMIESLVDQRDAEHAIACIDSVLVYIQKQYADNHAVLLDQTHAAVATSTYLRMHGAMMKMLLEAWVLTLPVEAPHQNA